MLVLVNVEVIKQMDSAQIRSIRFMVLSAVAFSLPVFAETSADKAITVNASTVNIAASRLDKLEQRIATLESENAGLKKSLDQPYISDSEPEISARLKAVESLANSYRSAARTVENLQGIETSVGFTMMAQTLSGGVSDNDPDELNYRADATVSLPAGSIGTSEGFFFSHFRMGQGLGLENPDNAFSSFNGTSFQRPGSETSDSTVLLAQAWYQLNIPLPLGGNPDLSKQHLEMNVGKIDPFMFFDQNSIADDETYGFVNQSFLHNPLLDVGADIGVDDFGFTPGVRVAWVNDTYTPAKYVVSMGVFGAGNGASFEDSLSSPLYIMQVETQQNLFVGLEGNYRLYYWHNAAAKDLNANTQTHAGIGLSADQKIDDYTTIYTRLGWQSQGEVKFDRTVTVGIDFGGSYWNRAGDAIGVSLGWLMLSDEYKARSPSLIGYTASGSEQIAEVFYRYRINGQLTISPNLQFIRQSGGDQQAATLSAYGLRTQLNF
jgi:high affinity Mn2+ porin